MKAEFEFENWEGYKSSYKLRIEKDPAIVRLTNGRNLNLFIQDKDLERFAVNILKALNSKKLAK